MAVRVLTIGDRFVSSALIVDALNREVGDGLDISTMDLEWPVDPFHKIADVDEASGDVQELARIAKDAEVIVTQTAALTESVISAADNLKLIACTRGGPVNVNLEAASRKGVAVCYAPGRNAPAAAEYTVGLILAGLRRIPEVHCDLSQGTWRGDFYVYEQCGIELDGATVGVVGFGAIGSRVAKVMRAFGSTVLICDPYVEAARVDEIGARKAELDEVLSSSDVVSLHARLSDETRGMIGAEQIDRMPVGSVLVNTARGGLLDHVALCDALESGHLGAAALDVYEEEPPPEGSCLFKSPRLILSPHIAGATKKTAQRGARMAAQEVGRYLRGERLLNVANPDAVGDST